MVVVVRSGGWEAALHFEVQQGVGCVASPHCERSCCCTLVAAGGSPPSGCMTSPSLSGMGRRRRSRRIDGVAPALWHQQQHGTAQHRLNPAP